VDKGVTVHDVAKKAQVSTASVSRVINGTAFVSESTRRRIKEAIDELGFEPNASAKKLRRQQSQNIALVVSEFSNPFFPAVVNEVVHVANENDYSVFIIAGEEPEQEVRRLVASRSVDGLLLMHSGLRWASHAPLNDLTIPVVAFDRVPKALSVPVVQTDNFSGVSAVMSHLFAKGHRTIAHITGPPELSVSQHRLESFLQALQEANIEVDPNLIVAGDFTEESGVKAMNTLLNRSVLPDAVFACNDLMAIGAISAAVNNNVVVPDEIGVVGFDGIAMSQYISPRLTTYKQPVNLIARTCISMLLEMMQTDTDVTENHTPLLTLPGSLLIGEST